MSIMRLEDITHNHLKKLFEDKTKVDDEIIYQELDYSTLIAPTFNREGMDFLYLMGEKDSKFIPLFTDLDEYNKIFADSDLVAQFHDFDYYLSAGVDLIINPASIGAKINLKEFEGKPDTPVLPVNFTRFSFSVNELKVLANNIENPDLLSVLQEKSDNEAILRALARATPITLIYDYISKPKNDILEMHNEFLNVVTTPDGYMELYTSKNEIKKEDNIYLQVVNLNHFFEYLIRLDLKGFIINPHSNHVVIDRNVILKNFSKFKSIYDDSKYALATHYVFKLE